MLMLVQVGGYGWINLAQVRTIERRENGGAIVYLVGGQELALLPDEWLALEGELGRVFVEGEPRKVGVG